MSKDKKKDKLDNNMENISKKIESILQKRVLDITDKYKGKTRKGGYSVYLGYPQEMIEDLTKTIEGERERAIEDFITKMFGKRCKEYEEGCPVCDEWKLFDEYIK